MSNVRPPEWLEDGPFEVIVCGKDLTILYLNARAATTHAKEGGAALLGRNLLDCHPPEARVQLQRMHSRGTPSVYVSKKGRIRKLIYQYPWKRKGRVRGLVQLALQLPRDLP